MSRRMSGSARPDEASALEQHLSSCPVCRREENRLDQAWSALEALPAPGDAPDDWRRIEAAIDTRRRRWIPSWWGAELALDGTARALVVAVMIVIGTGGGLLVMKEMPGRSRPAPLEATAFAEAFAELPWDSPAQTLDRLFGRGPSKEAMP